MTTATMILSAGGGSVDDVSAAIGAWCRRWPAKELSRDFGVAIQTAKKWRLGLEMPAGRHLVAMAERWGQAFLDHAFAPVLDDLSLDRRLEALEASFALIRQDLCHDDAATPPAPYHGVAAPEVRGVARPGRSPLATARAVIVGVVLGALAVHMVPQVPATVADLVAEARDDWARGPRGEDGRRAAPKVATRGLGAKTRGTV